MKKSLVSKAAALVGALAMTFGFAACGQTNTADSSNSNTSDLKKVTFMLSWAPDTNHIGVYVAKNKGYFKDASLDVDIVAVAQAGAEQAVNNGVADFALSNLTNVGVYTLKGAHIKQVLQVQQKPSAIWCALASNTAIKSPKDLDGKTFATFGSNESDAVVRRMIQTDGGKGEFDKVTVGTSTFQTMESGKADFGGFYATWEGVQADMYGPKLNCFTDLTMACPATPTPSASSPMTRPSRTIPTWSRSSLRPLKRVTSTRTPTRMTPRRFSWTKPLTPTSSPNSSRRACRLSSTASTGAIRPRSRTALSCSAPTTSRALRNTSTSWLKKTHTPTVMTR